MSSVLGGSSEAVTVKTKHTENVPKHLADSPEGGKTPALLFSHPELDAPESSDALPTNSGAPVSTGPEVSDLLQQLICEPTEGTTTRITRIWSKDIERRSKDMTTSGRPAWGNKDQGTNQFMELESTPVAASGGGRGRGPGRGMGRGRGRGLVGGRGTTSTAPNIVDKPSEKPTDTTSSLPQGYMFKGMGPGTPYSTACPFCEKEMAVRGVMAHATRYCKQTPPWYHSGLAGTGYYIARLDKVDANGSEPNVRTPPDVRTPSAAAVASDDSESESESEQSGDDVGDINLAEVETSVGKTARHTAVAAASPPPRRSSRASRPAIAADGREKRAVNSDDEDEEIEAMGGRGGRGRRGGRGGSSGPSGRGRGRGRGAGAELSAPKPAANKQVVHVVRADSLYACGVPGCARAFKDESGLKRHASVMHKDVKGAREPFTIVPEGDLPAVEDRRALSVSRRARRAGSAAVGEPEFDDEVDEDEYANALDTHDASEDDGELETHPVNRRVATDDDATRDSSSDDEDEDHRETTTKRHGPGCPPGRHQVSRFFPNNGLPMEDDEGDLGSEELNREAMAAAGARGRKRKATADDATLPKPKLKRTCPVCQHVFVGPQGIPGHYKKHINKGTPEESTAGRAALDAHNAALAASRVVKPPSKRRRGVGRRGAPTVALSFEGEDADADEGNTAAKPFLLDATARNCTECKLRCKSQQELIQHMWNMHEIIAKDKVEVEGVAVDPAGLQPFEGEEVLGAAQNGYERYDGGTGGIANANAMVTQNVNRGQTNHDTSAPMNDGPNGADGDRVVDVELVRDLLIRQQTSERLLEDAKTSMKHMRDTMDLLIHQNNDMRSQITELFAAQRHPFDPHAEIRRVRVTNANELGYSPITLFGRMVWLTGIVASDRRCDTSLQTQQSLLSLKSLLIKAGTDLFHLLKISVFLSDIREADKMYQAWDIFFDSFDVPIEKRPVRITQVAMLKAADYLVELHAEAVMPSPIHVGLALLPPGVNGGQ